ncbi:uncharacterized protein ASCRUDRAFT_30673 [Ascoidea rubescens DSM 1968]|uniref:Thioesterase/thiol ester dehydrase-isomerase n=1 Tax=Ascoidea rubescens DSM 1968 TaxID=1344418 RepID=A0A1D2VPJ6_9ASCO|nr:hypothetical protein ASCRUDRAFT_30673 [Ascoidea rubescens DSM 1968]ODV63477.1 hypothetical protein ASCRUDRAFT_30673 [Ascoidea rubescens DSM 1968]
MGFSAALFQVLKYIFILYFLSSYKSIPLAYYFRFYKRIVSLTILPKLCSKHKNIDFSKLPLPSSVVSTDELKVFRPTILKTYNSPFECDFYLHKNNAAYFTECDIARTELMLSVFQNFMWHYQDSSPNKNSFFKSLADSPYVPVASIQAIFKKEIAPFQRYNIITRILTWDEKWIFVLSKFCSGKDNKNLHCILTTKYVLKEGRKTIPPKKALQICGIYNNKIQEIADKNLLIVQRFINTGDLENVEMFI